MAGSDNQIFLSWDLFLVLDDLKHIDEHHVFHLQRPSSAESIEDVIGAEMAHQESEVPFKVMSMTKVMAKSALILWSFSRAEHPGGTRVTVMPDLKTISCTPALVSLLN